MEVIFFSIYWKVANDGDFTRLVIWLLQVLEICVSNVTASKIIIILNISAIFVAYLPSAFYIIISLLNSLQLLIFARMTSFLAS